MIRKWDWLSCIQSTKDPFEVASANPLCETSLSLQWWGSSVGFLFSDLIPTILNNSYDK